MGRIALKSEYFCATCSYRTKYSQDRRTHVLSFKHQFEMRLQSSLPLDLREFNSSSVKTNDFPNYGCYLVQGDRTTSWKKTIEAMLKVSFFIFFHTQKLVRKVPKVITGSEGRNRNNAPVRLKTDPWSPTLKKWVPLYLLRGWSKNSFYLFLSFF